ncbi:MAG: hypothetical protein HYV75_08255 [Opitutae bacterium]|nr:hypothetical protein [Opitutae bacterium]
MMNRRDFIKNSALVAVALQAPVLRGATAFAPAPHPGPPATAAAERRLGVIFGFNAPPGYFSSAAARAEVGHMAGLGVRWCTVAPTVLPDAAVDEDDLSAIFDLLHARGIRTQLRPILGTPGIHGRAMVWFPSDRERLPGRISRHRADWFAGFADRTHRYARLARQSGCSGYGFAGEHDRMVGENDLWKNVLAAARSEFKGPIDSCHTPVVDILAELRRRPDHWFYDLDALTVSFFRPGADQPGATAGAMAEKFAREWVPYYRNVAEAFGKPVRFGECGCPSSTGGAVTLATGGLDAAGYAPAEQQNYLEAVCRAFSPEPWWRGLDWWTWEAQQRDRTPVRKDPAGDRDFALRGKPAAGTFQVWTQKLS